MPKEQLRTRPQRAARDAVPGRCRVKAAWELTPDPAARFGANGLAWTSFADGTSNTIFLVESASAVPWTKPEDVPVAEARPDRFSVRSQVSFLVLLVDGSARTVRRDINTATLRAALTRAGGEILGSDW